MFNHSRRTAARALCAGIALATATALAAPASAERLRASHQWPQDDVRGKMVGIIKDHVEAADVDLQVRIYPSSSLFKPKQQWDAMVKGQLGISAFPLDYASGRHPQFSATLMPGLVKNHAHAKRLNDSAFMDRIKDIINEAGVVVLSDAWLAGGFVGDGYCVKGPDSVEGKVMRAAGPAFEEMLAEAGASINAMPSSEIYSAMQTGVLDGANTSSGSLVSYRIYEQSSCLTPPGDYALWFMYEPILMSKRVFEQLNAEQQQALREAGEKAEEYFFKKAKQLDRDLVKAYKKAGVEVHQMSKESFDAWIEVAKQSSYKNFAEEVEGGQKLIDMALSVD
jgi:TRAP-type C4-dicarboxylate transport system substrate-binding protein